MKSMCVFTGASVGGRPEYASVAENLASEMLARRLRLVYGGGGVGLMGVLARAVLAGGGEVVGVIPRALYEKEVGLDEVTELIVVGSMHERKAVMVDRSDGFMAMPGGIGTMEELFEVFTWAQLGFHDKPCALLDAVGYYDRLIGFLRHAVAEGFLDSEQLDGLLVGTEPGALLDAMTAFRPRQRPRWVERDES